MNNEQELLNILKNIKNLNIDELYDDLTIIKDQKSEFDESEYDKFIMSFALLNRNRTDISASELTTLCDNLRKANSSKLAKFKSTFTNYFKHWIQITSLKANDKESNIKIYLSVDNSNLHLFANKFILACLNSNLEDFCFKVNNNSSVNRRDNIVVYCNQKNFGSYIRLIQNVITDNPNIKFNSPHLLGIPYNDKISCGFDYENGQISYTENCCQNIYEALKMNYPPEKIAEMINYKREKLAPTIYALIDRSDKSKEQK